MEIYVLGNSRSGTTMMGRILNNHSDVYTFGELHFFEEIYTDKNAQELINKEEQISILSKLISRNRIGYLQKDQSSDFIDDAKQMSDVLPENCLLLELFSTFLSAESSINKKHHSCDQTPRNIFYLDTLAKDPRKKIILMVRDPRAVLLSQKKKWKRRYLGANQIPLKESIRSWANYHPYTISKMWNTTARLALNFASTQNVLVVKYEDLISDPKKCVQSICDFLELPFQAEMLQIPKLGSSNKSDNSNEKGIFKNDNEVWKSELSQAEIHICQKVNAEVMQKMHYDMHSTNLLSKVQLPIYAISWVIKTTISLILNIHRIKNFKETIKRRFLPNTPNQTQYVA
jgi:hypothetical protein